ncbi:hypothetical protein BA059_16740 [Mycolicibacterium sp. (ex Dasyatis americana)]|nr:hypothetical protein BA059_16740 [Mycolicibacterium sp. (ex Dasyatis americana)]
MTAPSIATQANAIAERLKQSVPAYQPPETVAPSVVPLIELAELVGELARRGEQQPAETVTSILLEHQGPFFNGAESQCSCGLWVKTAGGWAAHVARALGGAS